MAANTGGTSAGGAATVTTGGTSSGGATTTLPTGGFEKTKEGFVHRPQKGVCHNALPSAVPDAGAVGDGGSTPSAACAADVDCIAKPYGKCLPHTTMSGPYCSLNTSLACEYGCVSDSDCAANHVCLCGPEIGSCVPASNCQTDAECSEGQLCLLSPPDPRYPNFGPRFSCSTVGTQCVRDGDCTAPSYCVVGRCQYPAACGRPFLVEGAARTAAAVLRADFLQRMTPSLAELSRAERAALAQHYAEVGLMEHASIAAFARFTLELLSFGAPAELVAASNAALADELEHARLAFGLSSAYRGERVGPGPLSTQGVLSSASFVEAVRTAFLEACVGETCAAIEASEARHWARDRAVKDALDRIAADEMRHAALGYRFVEWALETSPPELAGELRDVIRRELAQLLDANHVARFDGEATALTAHGLLPEAARAASRALALTDVVLPAVNALLGARSLSGKARQRPIEAVSFEGNHAPLELPGGGEAGLQESPATRWN